MTTSTLRRYSALAGAVLLLSAAGCGTSSDDGGDDDSSDASSGFTPPDLPMLEELGETEGEHLVMVKANYWIGF